MTDLQKKFLKTELFIFSWEAATEHNKVWNSSMTLQQKQNYKNELKLFLEDMLNEYLIKIIDEDEHIQNILNLQTKTEELKNKLNFGTCQKLLNMMCKYYWCSGLIKEPVHLPIDRINLKNAGIKNCNWTELDDKDTYKRLVAKFKEVTAGKSLASWELENWCRRNFKEPH